MLKLVLWERILASAMVVIETFEVEDKVAESRPVNEFQRSFVFLLWLLPFVLRVVHFLEVEVDCQLEILA